MATALFSEHFQVGSSSGQPMAGALLYFYSPGTTTPITTYADSGLITPSTTVMQTDGSSAIVADNTGTFAPIYVTTSPFKFVLKTAGLITIQTVDPAFVPVTSGGTTQVLFGDGTVSLPGIAFTNDPNTGIYRIGADDIGISAGGAKIAEFSSTGALFQDNLFTVFDNSDPTRQAVFEASGITSGTKRTYTLPDANGTFALLTTNTNPAQINGIVNLTLVTSVAGSARTISIKTLAGVDPSASDPIFISFRDVSAITGGYTTLTLTAAASLVLSSGSTMGFSSTVPGRLWVVGFNDAGTFRMGAVNALSTTSVMALRDGIYSSTAEGGSGTADSALVIYTGTAVTAKAMRILGYIDVTETTAGTWAATPTNMVLMEPGIAKPGEVVQVQRNGTGAVSTGTTVLPDDDTIPQSAEGNQVMTQAITPTSASNLLDIDFLCADAANSAADGYMAGALFQDSTANALAGSYSGRVNAGNNNSSLSIRHRMLAATTSATTMKIRMGTASAGTLTFNGASGARKLGGVLGSWLEVREIMA